MLASGQSQVVLGPCPDGGYYLVGLSEPHPSLFQGPAWSGSTVLADTRRLARQLDLRVRLLPPWLDIDTADNLRTFLHQARPAPPTSGGHADPPRHFVVLPGKLR